jgi:predicted nuclease of restriction endonuclease-like (RecB) superfamily
MSAELDYSGTLQKSQTLFAKFDPSTNRAVYPFTLSWSHYLILMRIENEQERNFYEIEATKQQWSFRQLQRQYGSSLYERLALSRNKDEIKRLSNEGQTIEKPRDILKNPLVLEFLGLEEKSEYSETNLETAIILKLQKFLLEMGKGFLFEARQKRFTFNEKSFFVDLVLYNRLLDCYIIIDLKTDDLKHQDLGQMQMYVNYFDRYVKTEKENPTVGILLCKEKDDNIVELTLSENANIYASEYNLYLPDKTLLQQKLAQWVEEFEEAQEHIKTVDDTD